MSKLHSYEQISEDFELWGEYVDPGATMTEDDFDSMSKDEKIELQRELFGEDDYAEGQETTAEGSDRRIS